MNKTSLLVILVILFSAVSSNKESLAFKSGYVYEAIHKDIIKKALKPKGLLDKKLNLIIKGADSQDDITSKKFTDSPTHHFDDCLINESIAYFKDRFSTALSYCPVVYKNYGSAEQNMKIRNTLFTFGEGLHTIQDFYSHSNYAEMLARNGNKDVLVDWNSLPKGIKTGYFYWHGYTNNESTRSRATSVKKIIAAYQKKGKLLKFHNETKWANRKQIPTLQNSLAYVLDPKYQCLHLELNKDDEKQTEGAVKLPDGRTLHAKARTLAIMETDRQWDRFVDAIEKKYGKRSQLIIPALKGYNVPKIKLSVKMPKHSAENKAIRTSCYISLKVPKTDVNLNQQNTGKYDLTLKATVYNGQQKEAEVKHELKKISVGSTGGIVFDLPPLKGTGSRIVRFKAMFSGDSRYGAEKLSKTLTIGEDSLVNSKWLIKMNFGGKQGIRTYKVTVLKDDPGTFNVRVMGSKSGDTPAVFKGKRTGKSIYLKGWNKIKVKKIVGGSGSLDSLNAGRVVDTGKTNTRYFDINAKLSAQDTKVNGLLKQNKKHFYGSRIK